LNCGTLPDALIESELFGHTRGAFTDAREAKGGLVAAAEGGTLFLDEVDSLSSRGQVALLRLLQDREYRPVGGRAPLKADIRIVAATNTALDAAVARGCFREDLLFRLRVLTVTMPPLRERAEDVKLLTRSFLARFAAEYGRPAPRLTEEAEGAIASYAWPGNVRELENRLLSAFLLAEAEVPLRLPGLEASRRPDDTGLFREARARTIAEFERRYLTTLLRRVGGNMSRASREAGKERSSLIRLVRKHGLKRDDFA
jgi:DNA-binding NtrC family response regulator